MKTITQIKNILHLRVSALNNDLHRLTLEFRKGYQQITSEKWNTEDIENQKYQQLAMSAGDCIANQSRKVVWTQEKALQLETWDFNEWLDMVINETAKDSNINTAIFKAELLRQLY